MQKCKVCETQQATHLWEPTNGVKVFWAIGQHGIQPHTLPLCNSCAQEVQEVALDAFVLALRDYLRRRRSIKIKYPSLPLQEKNP